MHRRNFLTAAAVATAAPLIATARDLPQVRIKVLDAYLTNAEQFPTTAWPEAGSRLHLRRDPQRTYDTRSVQVLDGRHAPLGYLPPASAQILAALMDHGTAADAVAGAGGRLSVFIVAG